MAIQESLSEKKPDSKWKINVIRDRCKGCGFCIEFCPLQTLKPSDEYNIRGVHYPVLNDDGDSCVGCQICEMQCPDLAIFITKAME